MHVYLYYVAFHSKCNDTPGAVGNFIRGVSNIKNYVYLKSSLFTNLSFQTFKIMSISNPLCLQTCFFLTPSGHCMCRVRAAHGDDRPPVAHYLRLCGLLAVGYHHLHRPGLPHPSLAPPVLHRRRPRHTSTLCLVVSIDSSNWSEDCHLVCSGERNVINGPLFP